MRTISDTIRSLPSPAFLPLPTPPYSGAGDGVRLGLAVKSMENHSTDEGWQLYQGLEAGGYSLIGRRLPICGIETDVAAMLPRLSPTTVVLQDKREWEGKTAGRGFDQRERFTNVEVLRDRPDVFKLTILKDAHQEPAYHRQSAEEIGCHAWVTYYHPDIVHHLAPWTRKEHLVRTYHTVDPGLVMKYSADGRDEVILSGARNLRVYPLRGRIWDAAIKGELSGTRIQLLVHPGYGRNRCYTPSYLRTLSGFKVAICTTSIYGYALRKIIEATACGCMVLTDLPSDDGLVGIDGNLWRTDPNTPTEEVGKRLEWMIRNYNPGIQKQYAEAALELYSYEAEGKRLAKEIERLRSSYPSVDRRQS